MPPCRIDHFFVVELAEIVAGVTTFALLCETFQLIRSSSSSCRSKVGSDRPLGFAFMPCAHGSIVTSDVLPLQSIDGVNVVADVVGVVEVEVIVGVVDEVEVGGVVEVVSVEVVPTSIATTSDPFACPQT